MDPILKSCVSSIDLISKNANQSPEAFGFVQQRVGPENNQNDLFVIDANSKLTELFLKTKHAIFGGGELYRKRLEYAIEQNVTIINKKIDAPYVEIEQFPETKEVELPSIGLNLIDESSEESSIDWGRLSSDEDDDEEFVKLPAQKKSEKSSAEERTEESSSVEIEADKVSQIASFTDLFLTAQRYNHSIGMAANENLACDVPLFNELELPLLSYPDAAPVLINGAITTVALENMPSDQHITDGNWHSHKLYHYNAASLEVSNGSDAAQIFFSTQFERFLSMIGRIVETMVNTSFFSSYHYFSNGEDKEGKIYAKDAPLSKTEKGSSFFVGHATLSINVPVKSTTGEGFINVNVITDPVLGHMQKLLYPRMTDPARPMDDCPVPHVFLLSHNHRDHYDEDTLKTLVKYQPVMIVPEGDGEKFRKLGFKNIHENNWWQKTTIPISQGNKQGQLEITAVPANHWSGQGPCDGHHATFLGFVIHKDGGDVYFAGDTARLTKEHIKALRDQFDIRTMFQPGGPDECRENMKGTHQSSVDAIWMHFELMLQNLYEKGEFENRPKAEFIEEAKKLRTIYMHNKTFKLGNLHFDDTEVSVERLKQALETGSEEDLAALRAHELEVLNQLKEFWIASDADKQLFFKSKDTRLGFDFLTPEEVLEILNETIIIPQIGSRTEFAS